MTIPESIQKIASGSFPIVQALFLAYIAYQQWVTNDKKFKLDLYSKRFQVYLDALDYWIEVKTLAGRSGQVNAQLVDASTKFARSIQASRYLFSKDLSVHTTLNNIYIDLQKIINYYQKPNTGQSVGSFTQGKVNETLDSIEDKFEVLTNKLAKHLNQ